MNNTQIQLTYCGMAGQGRTVKEAKQDAARKIEAALSASYEPKILVCGDYKALVWRTPFGIESSYFADDGHLGGTCLHGNSTWAEVLRSVCYGLAQLSADVESDDIPSIIAFDKNLVDNFRGWLGFQRAYRHAKDNTATWQCENDWHRWACDHSKDFAPRLEVA